VDATRVAILGAIAGFTIFLGLPVGRIRSLPPRGKGFLSVVSAGILLFIFWDVVSAANQIIDGALGKAIDGGARGPFVLDVVMAIAGLTLGALGLAWLEGKVWHREPSPIAGGSADAVAVEQATEMLAAIRRRAALSLGMMIAVAIGLHNFSEGLAIGVSARSGQITLATTLIVGFALHNATEGFGIVGPLGGERPSWRWLLLAGLVAGGPTFLGTLVGYRVSSLPLEIAFFALAAGAILYVVGQIWGSASRRFSTQFVLTGLIVGFTLGLLTDLAVSAGGG
jgi:ZIP family zinc transporter